MFTGGGIACCCCFCCSFADFSVSLSSSFKNEPFASFVTLASSLTISAPNISSRNDPSMRKSGILPPFSACFNKCINTQKSPKPKLDPSDVQLAFHIPASFSFGKPVFVAMAATCAPVTPSAFGSFNDFLSVYHAFLERSRSSRLM